MLVLEHGTFDQAGGWAPGSGRLLRMTSDGGRQVILDGLTRPVSVLTWDDRHLVVSELGESPLFLDLATREA